MLTGPQRSTPPLNIKDEAISSYPFAVVFPDGSLSYDSGIATFSYNIAFETPTGSINSSNRVFTVTKEPLAVILNGIWYFNGVGYVLTGSGPYTVTFDTSLAPTTGSTLVSLPAAGSAALLTVAQQGITYQTVANAAARLALSIARLGYVKQTDQPNILYQLIGTDSTLESSWFGFPYTTNGELVGPIIPRHDTTTNLNAIVLSAGEIAVDTTLNGIRVGDGVTAGGTGFVPPLVYTATATAGHVTTVDISSAAKYPGQQIKIKITAASAAAFSDLINITSSPTSVLTVLDGRILTIQLVVTNGDVTTARYIQAGGQNAIYAQDNQNSDHVLKIGGSASQDIGNGAIVILWCVDIGGLQIGAVPLGGFNYSAEQL